MDVILGLAGPKKPPKVSFYRTSGHEVFFTFLKL